MRFFFLSSLHRHRHGSCKRFENIHIAYFIEQFVCQFELVLGAHSDHTIFQYLFIKMRMETSIITFIGDAKFRYPLIWRCFPLNLAEITSKSTHFIVNHSDDSLFTLHKRWEFERRNCLSWFAFLTRNDFLLLTDWHELVLFCVVECLGAPSILQIVLRGQFTSK